MINCILKPEPRQTPPSLSCFCQVFTSLSTEDTEVPARVPHCAELTLTQILTWESQAHRGGARVCTCLQTPESVAELCDKLLLTRTLGSNHYSGCPVGSVNQGGTGSEKRDFLPGLWSLQETSQTLYRA